MPQSKACSNARLRIFLPWRSVRRSLPSIRFAPALAALRKAFEAVTSGPVTDDALRLPEVSHRGPLGPWKTLVRAIAHFYRQDDVACERCLQAIDPHSAPARLVPAMQAMLAQRPGEHRRHTASASLLGQVGGSMEGLRNALRSLDATFATDAQSKIIPEIQRAISACRGRLSRACRAFAPAHLDTGGEIGGTSETDSGRVGRPGDPERLFLATLCALGRGRPRFVGR